MPAQKTELNLLIFAASEISSGLSLAEKICDTRAYSARITIVGQSMNTLLQRIKKELENSSILADALVETWETDVEPFLQQLSNQPGLRLLLIAGLDQLDDFRKVLMKRCRHSVACFEPHPGLENYPETIWILEEETTTDPTWFCSQLMPYPLVKRVPLAELSSSVQESDHQMTDWVVLSCNADGLENAVKRSRSAIEQAVGPVLLLRNQRSPWGWFWQAQLPNFISHHIPQMEREQRQQLATQLESYSKLDFEFVALISCSTFLAAFGLIQNSAAVIIGAMLVAPLMTPILGAGLSLAHGNRPLFLQSMKTILLGFCSALLTSFCFGLLVRFLVPVVLNLEGTAIHLTPEMWSRTHPTAIDFLVGLVGGSAAAFARTRAHLADALAGAAIAAALVPPIATAGLHIAFLGRTILPPEGTQLATNLIYGPVLLFIANMLTIMIGSSFVLWACGVRASHGHSRKEKWSTRTTFLLFMLSVAVLVWIVQHP